MVNSLSAEFNPSRRKAIAGGVAVLLAGCGGSDAVDNPVTARPVQAAGPAPVLGPGPAPAPAAGPTAITFAEASVHDPSVIRVDGTYYVFGSHLAAAKSTDLMNWTKLADGVDAANPLFDNVLTALAPTFAWSQVNGLWAADVARLGDGRFYFYYNSCKGDSPRSAMGVAVAAKVEGPYVDQGMFLRSGMWGQVSEDGVNVYDALTMPNVVDPQTFFDRDGKLWMIYGSYSGGIFIMKMDPATGKPLAGQGYGKHLIGGNHSRIEGAYVLYSPESKFYYLFTSFGGLDANGAYNMRVARSFNPDGPYLDAKGNDMATVKSDPSKPLFDDASIAPFGQKIMGSHQFALAAGQTGPALGYVSPGHNSAYHDAATGQYFLIFHTRFPGTGELHQIRVHQMFINADGWLVVAPFRYAPLSLNATPLAAAVTAADTAGSYQMINHGKDISAAIKPSQNLQLTAGGAVTGAATGTWTYDSDNRITLVLGALGTFKGVLSRQWNTNASAFVVTWTAQSVDGVSVWGARTGN